MILPPQPALLYRLCRRLYAGSSGGRFSSSSSSSSSSSPAPPSRRRLSLEEVTAFCKRTGFIFPGSELYGSSGTGYDYGPLGVALKKNVQDAWWRDFVERRADVVGLESAVLMNPRVWHASGHVAQFVDPLCECASCRARVRADKLLADALAAGAGAAELAPDVAAAAARGSLSLGELRDALQVAGLPCPACGARAGARGLGPPRTFNLLFQTHVGALAGAAPSSGGGGCDGGAGGAGTGGERADGAPARSPPAANPNAAGPAFLRPETAQGAFVNFANIMASTRRKLPLGIAQVGKAFRNEISVGGFVFRTREFDQMELQYFCAPADSPRHFDAWVDTCERWLASHGLAGDAIRRKEYAAGELAHYALATTDLEFRFPWGWGELWGIANRGDFDLRAHSAASGTQLTYRVDEKAAVRGRGGKGGGGGGQEGEKAMAERGVLSSDGGSSVTRLGARPPPRTHPQLPPSPQPFFPHAVEPSLGVNRLLLALLCEGLVEEQVASSSTGATDEAGCGAPAKTRLVFRLSERLAPAKAAVLPVVKAEAPAARTLHEALLQHLPVEYDETRTIGARYRRQDEIGTPLCIGVDRRTSSDGSVSVRCRDSMRQVRMQGEELVARAARGAFSRAALEEVFRAAGEN